MGIACGKSFHEPPIKRVAYNQRLIGRASEDSALKPLIQSVDHLCEIVDQIVFLLKENVSDRIKENTMSKLFERVKRDILAEMKSARAHCGQSWSRIMLENASRLTTEADQKAFYEFILDPTDSRDQEITFEKCDPQENIPATFTIPVDTGDEKTEVVECSNHITRNGASMFIDTRVGGFENITLHTPLSTHDECKEEDDEEEKTVGRIEIN